MFEHLHLEIMINSLVELGHAPIAGQLIRKVFQSSRTDSQRNLLALIDTAVENMDFTSLQSLFNTDSISDSLGLTHETRAMGNYVVNRYLYFQMLMEAPSDQNIQTGKDAETFLLTKLIPALNEVTNILNIPIFVHFKDTEDHALSLLLQKDAIPPVDPNQILSSENMLVPITQSSFLNFNSSLQCLFYILSYVLPKALGLFDTTVNSSEKFQLSSCNLSDVLSDAIKYRVSRSLYYLPPRLLTNTENNRLLNKASNEIPTEEEFPMSHLHTLSDHKDEVWFVKFSPSGRFLATGSLDDTCIIYDVIDNFRKLAVLAPTVESDEAAYRSLSYKPALDKNKGVICIAWDPHERFIVLCCLDTVIRVWDVELLTQKKRVTRSMDDSTPKLVSCFSLGVGTRTWPCEFLETDKDRLARFIVGSPDKVLKAYNIHGVELLDFYSDTEEWQQALDDETSANTDTESRTTNSSNTTNHNGKNNKNSKNIASQFNRINDLAITPNGKFLVSANNDKQVFFYEIPDLYTPGAITNKIGLLSLNGRLTSCNISASGKYMLLSIAPELLQVWDISPLERREKPFLKSKLLGLSQALFMIRSCFGYLPQSTGEEELVLSGSDDGCIYIWRLETGQLISRVSGHDGLCNSVDWNRFYVPPKNGVDYGQYWASVGDDKLVKIWGPRTS